MYLPIIYSVDSLIAAACMAWAGCPEAYQQRAMVGFMAFDTLAGLAGSSLPVVAPGAAILPAFALAALALICARRWTPLYLLIPVLLSVDNLTLGAAAGPVTLWSTVVDGLWSGTLAWAGFVLARSAMRRLKRPSVLA